MEGGGALCSISLRSLYRYLSLIADEVNVIFAKEEAVKVPQCSLSFTITLLTLLLPDMREDLWGKEQIHASSFNGSIPKSQVAGEPARPLVVGQRKPRPGFHIKWVGVLPPILLRKNSTKTVIFGPKTLIIAPFEPFYCEIFQRLSAKGGGAQWTKEGAWWASLILATSRPRSVRESTGAFFWTKEQSQVMLWPQKFAVFIFPCLIWNTNFNSKLEGKGKDPSKKESIHVVKNGIFFHNYQGGVSRDKWAQACRFFDDLSVKNIVII